MESTYKRLGCETDDDLDGRGTLHADRCASKQALNNFTAALRARPRCRERLSDSLLVLRWAIHV